MGDRQRHPKPDGERLLATAEDHNCGVSRRKGYFKVKCPCGVHMTTVHLTPQRGHFRAKLRLMEKWPCWSNEESS